MAQKILVLENLGSPENPYPKAVGKYLREFLMDFRVIDIFWLWRALLVYCIIAPFRKYRSAKAYQKVWTKEGSPLVVVTQKFAQKLQGVLGQEFKVIWGMRYGKHNLSNKIKAAAEDKIYFIPLYPHYATSSSLSALDHFVASTKKSAAQKFFLKDFFDQEPFIDSVARKIKESGDFDYLVFSYHGLPERQLKKLPQGDYCRFAECCDTITPANRDCYRAQSFATTRMLVKKLKLKEGTYGTFFQSRLGSTPWIQPYTDIQLETLAKNGVKRVGVVCPSFVTDCLETLEEIAIAGKETFISFGGEDLQLIPCLNDSDYWVDGFAKIIKEASWSTL